MNDISFSRVGTRFLTCFPFRPTLRTLSPPPSPLASLHFYRINEFSSCAPVFPGKRRREGGGERLLLRHKGCDCENVCFAFRRLPPETRRGGLASPCRSHKSGPTVFPGGSNAYRVFRVSRSRMGRGESGGSERRGAEGEEEEKRTRKRDGGRKREAKKSCWRGKGARARPCARVRA